jgi:UPF0271 protein
MRAAVESAKQRDIAVGAHPGLPDKEGFGRRPMFLSAAEVKDCITYQLGAMQGFVAAAGMALHHVKLHGYLAGQCNREADIAAAFVEAVAEFDDRLLIYNARHSEVWTVGEKMGVPLIAEYYADVPISQDGTRVVRPGGGRHPSMTPEMVRERVRDFLTTGSVPAWEGGRVPVIADTISVHTDDAMALDMARAVRAGIADASCELSSALAISR